MPSEDVEGVGNPAGPSAICTSPVPTFSALDFARDLANSLRQEPFRSPAQAPHMTRATKLNQGAVSSGAPRPSVSVFKATAPRKTNTAAPMTARHSSTILFKLVVIENSGGDGAVKHGLPINYRGRTSHRVGRAFRQGKAASCTACAATATRSSPYRHPQECRSSSRPTFPLLSRRIKSSDFRAAGIPKR
jgi:hypothetical protein